MAESILKYIPAEDMDRIFDAVLEKIKAVGNGVSPSSISAMAGPNAAAVGSPSVEVSVSQGKALFTFNFLKGEKGDQGLTGPQGPAGDPGPAGADAPLPKVSKLASLANIPADNNLVFVTLSSAPAAFSLSGSMAEGREMHVIVVNNTGAEVTVPFPSSFKSAEESLTIGAGSYGEINVISDGANLYLRSL